LTYLFIVCTLLSVKVKAQPPSENQIFGDAYFQNNTNGNTFDGFHLTESTGASKATSANSIYYLNSLVKDAPGAEGNYYYELTWTADGTDLIRFDLDAMSIESLGGRYRLDFSAISGGNPVSSSFTYNGVLSLSNIDIDQTIFKGISAFTLRVTNLSGASSVANIDLRGMTLANINAALPVNFGTIQASLKNSQLSVDWTTNTETSNKHFEIQVSNDGDHFKTLSIIPSRAIDGNSSTPLQYNFSIGLTEAAALLGLAGLSLISFSLFRCRRIHLLFSLPILLLVAFGCSKKHVFLTSESEQKLFVRIAQIDKDGTKYYSKVIKVVADQ